MKGCYLYLMISLFSICSYGQTVYIAGSYNDGKTEKACYWKNEKPIFLPEEKAPEAIAVENSNVYVAGNFSVRRLGSIFDNYIYCYKNGYKTMAVRLEENTTSVNAMDMAVCNGKIYITGELWGSGGYSGHNKWATWIGNVIESGGGPAIIANEGVVYSIKHTLTGDLFEAYGQRIALEGNYACGKEITVKNGTVYVAGSYQPNDRSRAVAACYWVDGKRTDLRFADDYCYASGIAVTSDGSIHVIGYGYNRGEKSHPYYWMLNESSGGLGGDGINASELVTIRAFKDRFYVLGYRKQGAFEIPCYWILEKDNNTRKWISTVKTIPGARRVTDMVVTGD